MATYKLPEGQKLATFKIDEQDWEAFKALCDSQGTNASRTLISFVEQSIAAGKIDDLFLPKPRSASSQSIDIDIDSLETRLMDRLMARLDDRLSSELQTQPKTIDPDIESRLDAMEAVIAGK
ncbi:hypothetical protein [Planktothrix sp. FACHB-1365]|uniref:hypothetical protein n=1 Tax=Planktothrix sp. FACHB-1365 TaxID=2692855 RepID=UPI001689AC23|nr:hypothetical protein [Planktothrix sp. FACHB-1365]MBD2485828.1 hypothetical protein [Planktothrix sp. FACHB-1365]